MSVKELKKLLKGETIAVLNGKGKIMIDFEYNQFVTLVENDFLLDNFETIEEALQAIENWYQK